MKIIVLSSGSKGNTTLVLTKNTKILIDCGNTCKYICKKLKSIDVDPSEIDAILITHTHVDHINGLKVFLHKYNTKVYITEKMQPDLQFIENYQLIEENYFTINHFTGIMTVMSPILLSAEHGSGKGYRMKSGIRVFKDRGITARGNLLSRGDFRLNRDIAEEKIRKESGDFFVAQAEEMLEEEIPFLPLSLYRDFSLTAVRSRFERKHHRRRAMLLSLTLAEAYERKGRFVEKIF